MSDQFEREKVLEMVRKMEKLAAKISVFSQSFPAIERNVKRVQASIAMMKLNLGE